MITAPNTQQGAALIVGLVLLLIMTVLGVSTMSTASMELKMAGNAQFFENAFQLAETGGDVQLQRLNGGSAAIPPVTDPNTSTCAAADPPVTVPAMDGSFQNTLCVTGIRTALGDSFGEVSTIHFENTAQGIAQGQASSVHRQGLAIRAPGLNGT